MYRSTVANTSWELQRQVPKQHVLPDNSRCELEAKEADSVEHA